ncbi:hypothetical protein VN0212_05190 [Helicobacter pylori]|nr:hypothetical protein VN0212_05190 [Helicobacter pylori]
MEEQKDMGQNAILTKVLKSLEKGGFFSPSDREKFAQTARENGIEGSVIEEVIDIGQTLSLIYRHEDRLDESDLAREEKKAVRAELQKSRKFRSFEKDHKFHEIYEINVSPKYAKIIMELYNK